MALDHAEAVIKRRRMRPESILAFTKAMSASVVAMEACCGAHHLGWLLAAQGHTVPRMAQRRVSKPRINEMPIVTSTR